MRSLKRGTTVLLNVAAGGVGGFQATRKQLSYAPEAIPHLMVSGVGTLWEERGGGPLPRYLLHFQGIELRSASTFQHVYDINQLCSVASLLS